MMYIYIYIYKCDEQQSYARYITTRHNLIWDGANLPDLIAKSQDIAHSKIAKNRILFDDFWQKSIFLIEKIDQFFNFFDKNCQF